MKKLKYHSSWEIPDVRTPDGVYRHRRKIRLDRLRRLRKLDPPIYIIYVERLLLAMARMARYHPDRVPELMARRKRVFEAQQTENVHLH